MITALERAEIKPLLQAIIDQIKTNLPHLKDGIFGMSIYERLRELSDFCVLAVNQDGSAGESTSHQNYLSSFQGHAAIHMPFRGIGTIFKTPINTLVQTHSGYRPDQSVIGERLTHDFASQIILKSSNFRKAMSQNEMRTLEGILRSSPEYQKIREFSDRLQRERKSTPIALDVTKQHLPPWLNFIGIYDTTNSDSLLDTYDAAVAEEFNGILREDIIARQFGEIGVSIFSPRGDGSVAGAGANMTEENLSLFFEELVKKWPEVKRDFDHLACRYDKITPGTLSLRQIWTIGAVSLQECSSPIAPYAVAGDSLNVVTMAIDEMVPSAGMFFDQTLLRKIGGSGQLPFATHAIPIPDHLRPETIAKIQRRVGPRIFRCPETLAA